VTIDGGFFFLYNLGMRVMCSPPRDFIYGFLQIKGMIMVNSKPQVLHYFGKDIKNLKSLLKEHKPDLLINHSFPSFELKDCYQVYHPLKEKKDLLDVKKVYTNAFSLCKFYYERIGMQAQIIILPQKKVKPKTKEVNFPKSFWTRLSRIHSKINSYLDWG